MLLCRANGVNEQNNCVSRAVIRKSLLQHDVHNYCIYKRHWPDEMLEIMQFVPQSGFAHFRSFQDLYRVCNVFRKSNIIASSSALCLQWPHSIA